MHDRGFTYVPAIWFSRKKGKLAVTEGTLSLYDHNRAITSFEDFLAAAQESDFRYGGSADYKWDGTTMWSSDDVFITQVEAHQWLSPILANYPKIPDGYLGWFSIKAD